MAGLNEQPSMDLSRIVADPGICGGRARIKGTRVRVVDVVEMIASGMDRADMLHEFPYLASEDISAALLYSARATDRPTAIVP
jgi:uncharacterized protein (DUF433 family)